MASSASSIETSVARIGKGVAPLRAGQGYSFVLRRLHSLSGIVPIGAFLIEHFISNSESANGVQAYNDQVKFLTSLPFVHVLEWVFIFIPLLYHALYGIWIWYRGDVERQRVSLERQLALHFAALDRNHRLRLHPVSRYRHAIHGRAPDGRRL